jgi:hypothetical protein
MAESDRVGGGWPGAAFSLNQGSVARRRVVLRPRTERCIGDGEASPCRAVSLVPVRRSTSPASAGQVPLSIHQSRSGPAGLRKNVRMTTILSKHFWRLEHIKKVPSLGVSSPDLGRKHNLRPVFPERAAGGRPLVHIIGSQGNGIDRSAEAIDHVGLRMEGYADFRKKLDQLGIRYSSMDLSSLGLRINGTWRWSFHCGRRRSDGLRVLQQPYGLRRATSRGRARRRLSPSPPALETGAPQPTGRRSKGSRSDPDLPRRRARRVACDRATVPYCAHAV